MFSVHFYCSCTILMNCVWLLFHVKMRKMPGKTTQWKNNFGKTCTNLVDGSLFRNRCSLNSRWLEGIPRWIMLNRLSHAFFQRLYAFFHAYNFKQKPSQILLYIDFSYNWCISHRDALSKFKMHLQKCGRNELSNS